MPFQESRCSCHSESGCYAEPWRHIRGIMLVYLSEYKLRLSRVNLLHKTQTWEIISKSYKIPRPLALVPCEKGLRCAGFGKTMDKDAKLFHHLRPYLYLGQSSYVSSLGCTNLYKSGLATAEERNLNSAHEQNEPRCLPSLLERNALFGVRWCSAVSFTELSCHCRMLPVLSWKQCFISMHLHCRVLFTSLASCQCQVLGRFFSRIDHDKSNLYVLV